MSILASTVEAELRSAGYGQVTTFDLTTTKLAFCQGEFDCWIKTPGLCRAHDAEDDIVLSIHDADALVLLGPVTFGGFDHVLKRALDRTICLLEPFFAKRASLTHHEIRYERAPRLFSVGWAADASSSEAATFVELNDANAINFLAPGRGAVVVDDAHQSSWAAVIREMFAHPHTPGASIEGRDALVRALLSAAMPDERGPSRIERAALLVGSPKVKGTSASESMARALGARLGVPTELHFVHEFVHDNERAAEAVARCDLLVLVAPLYVDALPALTTQALEQIARARQDHSSAARFVAWINCGFPEAEHIRTALRIARHFADRAGYSWGGGLPLGAGGVVTTDRDLTQTHGPTAHIARAIALLAPALAAGKPAPIEAIEVIREPMLPDALYRAMGDLGWRWHAYKNGLTQRQLHDRPLEEPSSR